MFQSTWNYQTKSVLCSSLFFHWIFFTHKRNFLQFFSKLINLQKLLKLREVSFNLNEEKKIMELQRKVVSEWGKNLGRILDHETKLPSGWIDFLRGWADKGRVQPPNASLLASRFTLWQIPARERFEKISADDREWCIDLRSCHALA